MLGLVPQVCMWPGFLASLGEIQSQLVPHLPTELILKPCSSPRLRVSRASRVSRETRW